MTEKQLIGVWVDPALHKAIKIKAAKEGTSISAQVREFLNGWLTGKYSTAA